MASLAQLAAFVAGHSPDERTRASLRLHVADTVGAWIAATGTAEGRLLRSYRKAGDGLAERIAVNVALTRLSEVDDIYLGGMVTPGSIVVPAALTMAAETGAGNDDPAAAIAAGYEAMVRLGAAIDGPAVLYRGIWPTYFAAPFGVAAVAARLLRLDAAQTAHALSMALIMASPGTGHHAAATTGRWLAVGHAAARGLQAARAAQAGFTSDVKIADGDFLKSIYGLSLKPAVLGGGLDALALDRVSFKPWCAARQTMAATQALKEIIAAGVPPGTIAAVEASVLPPHLKMIDHGVTSGDRFSHLTSVQYQMAVATLAPEAAFALSGPPGGISPDLIAFMARISVRADESLLALGYPEAWPARVAVTAAGQRHERSVTHVPGDPSRPVGEAELRQKFARVAAPAIDAAEADDLFGRALAALDRPAAMLAEIERLSAQT